MRWVLLVVSLIGGIGLIVAVGLVWLGVDFLRGEAIVEEGEKWVKNRGLPIAGDKDVMPSYDWQTLWVTDFKGNRLMAFSKTGNKVWEQHMATPPMPARSYNTAVEYVTVAPNGNLIVADGDGMMVQEIDRQTHKPIWQYGTKDIQGSVDGLLHQPDKAYKLNNNEILINDGNNRRVIIVDQRNDKIVWQYGETLRMGSRPGLLRGNTSVVPLDDGQRFVITDTLEKKIVVVNRTTKEIEWQWKKDDAKWLQHVWPTHTGTFVLEDRQKHEVFEVGRDGKILWMLTELGDGSLLRYPTDVIKLANGHVLIAEAGRGRVIEVEPMTGRVISVYDGAGFVTTIAIK